MTTGIAPTNYPPQSVDFHDLKQGSLEALLGLSPPPGISKNSAFRQLRKIEDYLLADEVKAATVAIEQHYIDRDFMEDFSIFYSRTLKPVQNFCRRLHFFRGTKEEVQKTLNTLVELAQQVRAGKTKEEEYRRECRKFSARTYCGFSVIKPLDGTPVGRTVLVTFPTSPAYSSRDSKSPDASRVFESTMEYRTHLLGLELVVRGLAFQQQDEGVSACATTAIWVALQKTREGEEIGPSTPAHISMRATQSRLPFGRSMPAEGLSIDQMCQAIDSLGLSPVLKRAQDYRLAKAELYSATLSRLTPVLVIKREAQNHAVTVVGAKLLDPKEGGDGKSELRLDADRLIAVYVHDDRIGPYQVGTLEEATPSGLNLRIRTYRAPRNESAIPDEEEIWRVTHILTPMHVKVRLSIAELYKLAIELLPAVAASWQTLSADAPPPVEWTLWVTRSHRYVEDLMLRDRAFAPDASNKLSRAVPLARYLGVIRMRFGRETVLDFLVDTTSTFRNPSYLALICGSSNETARRVGAAMAVVNGCSYIE